jgi:hypothetical protein
VSIIHDDFKIKEKPMDVEDEAEDTPRRSVQLKGKEREDVPNGENLCPTSPNLDEMDSDDIGNYCVHLTTHQKARQKAYDRRIERERMKKENPPPPKESITNNYG